MKIRKTSSDAVVESISVGKGNTCLVNLPMSLVLFFFSVLSFSFLYQSRLTQQSDLRHLYGECVSRTVDFKDKKISYSH